MAGPLAISGSFALLLSVVACRNIMPPPLAPAARVEPSERVNALADATVAEVFEYSPERVALLRPPGARYDSLPDESPAAVLAREQRWRSELAELAAIPRSELADDDTRLAYDLARDWRERALERRVCRSELWGVSQMGGWQVSLANLAVAQPVGSADERAQALARFAQLPRYVDTQIAALREGLAAGWSAPRLVVDHVVRQLEILLATPRDQSPFASPALRGEDEEFRAAFLALVDEAVTPSLRRYRELLVSEYAPAARAELALAATPGGVACYRAALRSANTLRLSPEEIHARGHEALRETLRAMDEIAARSFAGKPPKEVLALLRSDAHYRYRDEAHVLAHAQLAMDRAWAALPRAFAQLPRARAQAEPIPAHQARTAAAHYLVAALDGSRPGTYRVRTIEPSGQSWSNGESVAFHEIVPGHHLQIALASENEALPPIARFLGNSGFSEGWALYAEQLADELGLFSSDVDRIGMLSARAFRAARLVLDTGIHALGWERERAVQFLTDHTVLARLQAEQEIDRYVAQPGQATAYYLGYQEILALRAEAQRTLGDRFDLREFHTVVLGGGGVTLPLLRERVQSWVRASAEREPSAAPAQVDVRRVDGAIDDCVETDSVGAYRAELNALSEREWDSEVFQTDGGLVAVRVAFDAAGARALESPRHGSERATSSMKRILAAISSSPPPLCLRDSIGEIVFLVPWAPDRVLRDASEEILRSDLELPIVDFQIEPLDSAETREETD